MSTQSESTAHTTTSSEPFYSQNMLAQVTTTASTSYTLPTTYLDKTLTSSTSTDFATTTTIIATTTELVNFDSTSSTTTSALPTTTTYSTTTPTQTINSEIPFNQFISSSKDSSTEDEVLSQADAFSSISQQSMTAPIHSKDSDQSLASAYLNELSSAISSALGQDSNGVNDELEVQSSRANYKLPLEKFYVDILPYNSGYKLKVRNPNQMSKAVSEYLLSYFESLDEWSYANELIDFTLQCQKSQEKLASEVKRALSCEGDGIFDDSSLPRRREMNDLIHSAFVGSKHEEFLEYIYSDYVSEHDASKEDWQQLEEDPEQRSHDPLQDKLETEDKQMNEVKQNKKEQMMLEKKSQQMKDILDNLSGKKRMLRSRIDT